ncbi:doublecortin domain-containing protein 1-like [Protopterus annectens]|uniref:doublecortin domain-containing protein 1-like n=1 Tax=Protopterus annectens TaxID=7888 RepID=UPI001CFA982A|nr:doublecortin domain-containing protein 1-like [Protopterus annectens]
MPIISMIVFVFSSFSYDFSYVIESECEIWCTPQSELREVDCTLKIMEKKKRPASASTNSSRTSAMTGGGRASTSLSLRSQHSSLEDILVKEYMDKISRPSSSASVLSRKYISPYAKTTLISTKGKKRSRQPPLGLHTCPQSSVVVGRSRPHDCSRHQTKSVQSSDGSSDSDSSKSSGTNNSSFIPHSKRNRPVSAPAGQQRYQQLFATSKSVLSQKRFDSPSALQQQPWTIRVRAYKNGSSDVSAKVVAPNLDMLLEECTEKLKLNTAARRVFLVNGTEALEPKDIPHDADVYISTGEPFIDPFKKMKAQLSLAKEVNWTVNGIVFPTCGKHGKAKPSHTEHTRMLSENSTIRILVFRNGTGQIGYEVIASVTQMEQVKSKYIVN